MSYEAKVFKILIASPSDVETERNIISSCIYDWNAIHSENEGVVLLPVKWETHCRPEMGQRPQGIVNDQIVNGCDFAIGVFWSRLGSPTGMHESGTVEEIETFISLGKTVMVYFSKKDIPQRDLNIEQYQKLQTFRTSLLNRGLVGDYSDAIDLKEKVTRHLTKLVQGREAKPAGKSKKSSRTEVESNADLPAVEKRVVSSEITFEDYAKNGVVKSFVVKGDTKKIKEELKALEGKWNPTLGGWVFPKAREDEIREAIRSFM